MGTFGAHFLLEKLFAKRLGIANVVRILIARGLTPRDHLLASCHRERSVAICWR